MGKDKLKQTPGKTGFQRYCELTDVSLICGLSLVIVMLGMMIFVPEFEDKVPGKVFDIAGKTVAVPLFLIGAKWIKMIRSGELPSRDTANEALYYLYALSFFLDINGIG